MTKHAKFNTRKLKVLKKIKNGVNTINGLSTDMDITKSTVRSLLRNYRKQELIDKEKGEIHPYSGSEPNNYTITEKGEERIDYLEERIPKAWRID